MSTKKRMRPPAPISRGDVRVENRPEPRTRLRGPRTPRPWRAEADVSEPTGRGKLHRPRAE
jgi:hypothetical protein